MNDWFTVEQLTPDTWCISEYGHWEQTHCYLLLGSQRGLLIDTGLGVEDISAVVRQITDLPVTAVVTHGHWDHMGGLGHFSEFYAHAAELEWFRGGFPLPHAVVRLMLSDGCELPPEFCLQDYRVFSGEPAGLLCDGDVIKLGNREITVLHTPGHSPGHLCFWEPDRGNLFTGDLVYSGRLYANYHSTDPAAYLQSLERLAELPVRFLYPGHHELQVSPGLICEIRDQFRLLLEQEKLCHGSGVYTYPKWSIEL